MYTFIINPVSGSGKGRLVWKKVKTELDRLNVSYKAYVLSGPGEAKKLSAALSRLEKPQTIVAVGGDGTINEIFNGIIPSENITFSCIPTGSGNDFVRGLKMETDPIRALHRILNPSSVQSINLGRTTTHESSRCFGVSSGFGYDAAVCDIVEKSLLKKALNVIHCGKLVYLFIALQQLLTMKRQTIQVIADGAPEEVFSNTYFAAAMNLSYEGGGFQFCPDADPSDNKIDLFIAHDISRFRVLCLLPLAFAGRHVGKPGIRIIRCSKAQISLDEKFCLHTDGEVNGYHKQVSFTLLDERLRVIV